MYKTPPTLAQTRTPRRTGPKTRSWLEARTTPTKREPPGSTKGKHHKTATTNPPRAHSHDLTTRLFGIDFWHAVEFSRIKRAPPQTFRPSVGATVPTYLLDLRSVNFGCQPLRAVSLRPAGRPVDNSTRSSEGPRPPLVPPRCAPPCTGARDVQRQDPRTCSRPARLFLGARRWSLSAARSSGP